MGYEERACSREQRPIPVCQTMFNSRCSLGVTGLRPTGPPFRVCKVRRSASRISAQRFGALVDCYRVYPSLRSISNTTTHRWGSRNGQTNPLRPKPIEALRKPDTSAYQIRIDVFLMKLRLLTPRPTPKKTPEVFITEFSSPLPC